MHVRRRLVRNVIFVGTAYLAIGMAFGTLASDTASNQVRVLATSGLGDQCRCFRRAHRIRARSTEVFGWFNGLPHVVVSCARCVCARGYCNRSLTREIRSLTFSVPGMAARYLGTSISGRPGRCFDANPNPAKQLKFVLRYYRALTPDWDRK